MEINPPMWAVPLLAKVDAIQTQLDTIQTQLARIENSTATGGAHKLQPIPVNGLYPEYFQVTFDDVGVGLTHAQANALILFYGINPHIVYRNNDADLKIKAAAIRAFIGIR